MAWMLSRRLPARVVWYLCLLILFCGQDENHVAAKDVMPTIEYLRPGLRLTQIAADPDVVTPTGIDADDAGNVWAVASHTHFRPDNYVGPEHDEILVFDQQGNRRVFYTATDATMDLELGPDGWVYLAERGRILRVRDSDGDGVGDVEENLAVLKTEADYPHNGLAGLAWNPDGDLIFSLGENYWTEWTLTGVDGKSVKGTGEGGIFRCTSDGKELRRIAKGFWNPFGLCVLNDGTMFAAENDPGARPPCRLLHIVEGGDYGYQRLFGRAPFHPFVCWDGELPGTLPMLSATGEAPCGVVPLGGGLLVPSWADHRVDFFPLKRRGATFATERVEIISGSDPFRPTCIVRASPTTFYLSDWVGGSYELHGLGRIWRLDVDLKKADWIGSADSEQPNEAARLAERLRKGTESLSQNRLLELARGDDAFLASAALQSMSRLVAGWDDDAIRALPERDRVSVVLAAKLASPRDEKRVRLFLDDDAVSVRFEALRWMSEEQLDAFRPDVERMLKQSDLDYRSFEACLAAWNTLSGNPRAGISDPKMLLARLRDKDASSDVRAFALRLLPPNDKLLTTPILSKLLQFKNQPTVIKENQRLLLEVARTLSVRSDRESKLLLGGMAKATPYPSEIRAAATAGLANDVHLTRRTLIDMCSDEEPSVRREAFRALRGMQLSPGDKVRLEVHKDLEPDLAKALLHPESLKLGRPELTDTQAWLTRLDALNGVPDPRAGERIFHHAKVGLCANCHRHTGRGNVVGPDLSAVSGRGDRASILRAILEPNRDVAPQFYPWSLVTTDGKTFTGILLRKGGRSGKEFYRDVNGSERGFAKSDIEMRRETKMSLMPKDLVNLITDGEIRDLLAFLMEQ
jgi:putative membrane-bound dehydrogenase-like protein